jgi:ferredoxin
MSTATLKRSNDRKVTNLVTPNGKQSAIANTFGLPAGKEFSCPGATPTCEKVCYAGKLEKVYKGVRDVLTHNWNLLKDADIDTMVDLLDDMILDFIKDCDRRQAPKVFRIHWDGDFFSQTYEYAWQKVIMMHPDVKFWVYTRVESAAYSLSGLDNLSLYYSTDVDNKHIAEKVRSTSISTKLAYLADTFEDAKQDMLSMTGKVGAKCPENNKSIPLISANGSACFSCGLCIDGKADIRFSATKK